MKLFRIIHQYRCHIHQKFGSLAHVVEQPLHGLCYIAIGVTHWEWVYAILGCGIIIIVIAQIGDSQ